jgi:hypothetical protein
MLSLPIPIFRRRRGRARRNETAPIPPPPAPLALLGAVYSDEPPAATLTLVFDRPINIAALVGTAIVVDDGAQTYLLYNATGGAELLDPTTVKLTLIAVDSPIGGSILLSATGLSGIVAADDGGTWLGVTNLPLPFP